MSTYIKAVGPTTVNLAVPSDEALTLGKVIVHCDSTLGAITVNLPSIAALGAATNMEYIVKDAAGQAAVNNITIVADVTTPDKINNAVSSVINLAFQAAKLDIADTNSWIGYTA